LIEAAASAFAEPPGHPGGLSTIVGAEDDKAILDSVCAHLVDDRFEVLPAHALFEECEVRRIALMSIERRTRTRYGPLTIEMVNVLV
jgi:hypothetical protein